VRILFLSHYFPPEVNAPANRTFEHCRLWAAAGHDVHVVTCVPSHPKGVPFAGYRKGWYQRERIDGVTVHRVWTYLAANHGVVRRTMNYVSFVPTSVWRAIRLGRFDIIVATSPQFFCAVAGCLTSLLARTPWVFELRDLWPESVAAVGAVRRGPALRLLERLELRMYRHAARVVCVTRSFVANLESRGIPSSKLAFVPNGIDPDYWRPRDGQSVRAQLGVAGDDVLVSYVGTVGMAHGLGTVLDAAEQLRQERARVRFVVVGDGAELASIRSGAASRGLSNVSFTGLVPRDRARDILTASDVSLVTLRDSPLFRTVLPSKMFEAMAAGKPIVLGVGGEAREVLQRAGCGIAIDPEDAGAMCEAVERLAADQDLRRRMGEAGRQFVQREFDRRTWAESYLALLEQVAVSSVCRPSPSGAALD
jgi:glycosyltransferase involved in cell wall biosynthesis